MLDIYIDICKYINVIRFNQKSMKDAFRLFKALADKTRLEIAVYLAKKGELSCKELSKKFQLSQPTLSHHFGKLEEAGVIFVEKRGVTHFYRINENFLKTHGLNLKKI